MYDDVIKAASGQFQIDPNLIKAIIKTESNWDEYATRAEPKLNDTSYGLMQVLLNTGKMVTGNSSLTAAQLADPTLNILVGTKYLRQLWDKYGNMDDVIASYNAGSPIRSTVLPGYVNQGYVSKVKAAYALYNYGYVTAISVALAGGFIFFMMRKK